MATEYKYIDENEDRGIYYLSQIVKDGWVITKTEDYCHYDATITKGDKEYHVENKTRYIDARLANQGLLLDANKVNEDVQYYCEFVPKMNAGFVITYNQIQQGINDGKITKSTAKCAQYMFENPNYKVEKNNLLIPLELFKRFPLDCQDC
jgi:hypothetical protein